MLGNGRGSSILPARRPPSASFIYKYFIILKLFSFTPINFICLKEMMKQANNPFRYEFIEDDPEVINRVKEQERIRKALLEPGSRLLVHGRRRMGKTTVCKAIVNELRKEGHAALLVDFSTATQLADLSNALLGKITEVLGKRWQDYASALMKSLSLQLETEVDGVTGNIKIRLKPSARKAPMEEQRATFMGMMNSRSWPGLKRRRPCGTCGGRFSTMPTSVMSSRDRGST
jgi:transcriptional regulator NrdR family protein